MNNKSGHQIQTVVHIMSHSKYITYSVSWQTRLLSNDTGEECKLEIGSIDSYCSSKGITQLPLSFDIRVGLAELQHTQIIRHIYRQMF